MFLKDWRLHIILTNHLKRVSSERNGVKGIRRNPFGSLRDIKKGKLSFDPARYMIKSRDKWIAGGYDSLASELILDLKALLATDRFSITAEQKTRTANKSSVEGSTSTFSTKSEVGVLKEEISNLKEELSRLQRQITMQDEEPSQKKIP